MHARIALVKVGWSDLYQGGPVVGRSAYIAKYNEAHERFNFLRHSDGRFYGYLPPIGPTGRSPQPKIKDGWLLVFVSARKGYGPLTVVGWYDNATLHEEYSERPEYAASQGFPTDVEGKKYDYCLSADFGYVLPVQTRSRTVSGAHFKRSPILYVRGNGNAEAWRGELASMAEALVAKPPVETESSQPRLAFPDAALRKRVELAAIECAKKHLRKTYRVTDRQDLKCGYDLLATHRGTGEELHVEVKGTSGTEAHFYMTRNEWLYMPNPKWRLLVVTNALVRPRPKLLTKAEVQQAFSLEPFAWEATASPGRP